MAPRYGLASMRAGGDTYLVLQGVSQEERQAAGHWATGSVERGYHRLHALDYARRRLARGVTFAQGGPRRGHGPGSLTAAAP